MDFEEEQIIIDKNGAITVVTSAKNIEKSEPFV